MFWFKETNPASIGSFFFTNRFLYLARTWQNFPDQNLYSPDIKASLNQKHVDEKYRIIGTFFASDMKSLRRMNTHTRASQGTLLYS